MSKYILGPIFKKDFPITQRYGDNPNSYPMFLVHGHEGIDYGTPNGTEIIAPFDGVILRDTLNDKDYGNFLVAWDPVQHCALWFCHLQDTPVNNGDRISKGQVIAHSNNTGHSTGPHTHVNFVETDASGNRLNLSNGKQGFLNLLDTNLVKFSSSVTPQEVKSQITDQTRIPQIQNKEVQQIKAEIEAKDKALAEYEKKTTALIYDAEKAQKDLKDYIDQQKKKEESIEVTTTVYPKSPETTDKTVTIPEKVFSGPFIDALNFIKDKLFPKKTIG